MSQWAAAVVVAKDYVPHNGEFGSDKGKIRVAALRSRHHADHYWLEALATV